MFKVTRAETPPIPDGISPEGQSFIRLCLQKNPADRPSAAALLEHPFVQIPNDVVECTHAMLSQDSQVSLLLSQHILFKVSERS